MSTGKIAINTFFIILATVVTVNGSYEDCSKKYGPIPTDETCDRYSNIGSNIYLDNKADDILNTNEKFETPKAKFNRLNGMMPTDDPNNMQAAYDPWDDAFCFNEDYPVPSLTLAQQSALFNDYTQVFDKINNYTTDISLENNGVTNNRIPGMFLRMCFHDNAVDPRQAEFQTYVASSIDSTTKKWIGESRYMKTSGADASNLICPEERYHPNNNYDQTASRVLDSIQTILKKKYPQMSYADLLHNGCNAAAIYLDGQSNPLTSLTTNPFTFGRKDACHVDKKCIKRYPLCGPTEVLPGANSSATTASQWFTSRGISPCLFMGLMSTHTTVARMASMCPIKRLACKASDSDVNSFADKSKLYFKAGDELDYFSFFLNRGTHQTIPYTRNAAASTCDWNVDGSLVPWPMMGIDCALGLDNVNRTRAPAALVRAISNIGHDTTGKYKRVNIIQCALKILSGKGGTELGACKLVPTGCKSNPNHRFGGFYSTLPSSATYTRTIVDPRCDKYGYRRRSLTVTSPENVATKHMECLDVEYDMYLVIEGAHFAGLAMPSTNYTSSIHCPPVVLHTKSESNTGSMEKLMVVASVYDVEKIDEDTKFYLGSRPLASIVNAFDAASVGLNGATTYNPITNNCVSMLRNMADPLDIPLKENEELIEFVTKRLLSDSADHMFQMMENSPTLQMLYDGSNRLLKAMGSSKSSSNSFNKEDIVAKLVQLYL